MDQPTYDAGYLASLPPNIASLMQLGVDAQGQPLTGRTAGFTSLAQQGYPIDEQIMVLGGDPFSIMEERNQYGYTSVYGFLQAKPIIQVPPGITFNGITGQPNQGDVTVFWPSPPPPFAIPAPPSTIPGLTLGPALGVDFPSYYSMFGDSPNVPVGSQVIINNDKYTKQIIGHSPFAPGGNVTAWLQSPK